MRVKTKLTAGQIRALHIFNVPKGEMIRRFSASNRRCGSIRARQQAAHGVVSRLVKKGLLWRNGHGFYKTTAEGRRALSRLEVSK